ncbi:MAG: hypothetical protein ACE5GJ_06135 [Gemmatimonadota bacterium]
MTLPQKEQLALVVVESDDLSGVLRQELAEDFPPDRTADAGDENPFSVPVFHSDSLDIEKRSPRRQLRDRN